MQNVSRDILLGQIIQFLLGYRMSDPMCDRFVTFYKHAIKGVLHLLPQKAPKLACFVLYFKIINIVLKNDTCILE